MQLCKIQLADGKLETGVRLDQGVRILPGVSLSQLLHAADPALAVQHHLATQGTTVPLNGVTFCAPVDQQEIWAAGVTYKRSQEARERESVGAGRFYDLVYRADRPELFFKATPRRVRAPGEKVCIRRDSRWSVPEPEVALVISPALKIVGYTIGNDMSARDIEGENPLYLPQAKVFTGACSLGPVITLADQMPAREQIEIRLVIERAGRTVYEGNTSVGAMARRFEDLVDWLGRENSFPDGAILLTGTGLVPPDDFTLAVGDRVRIAVTGVGELVNEVAHP